MALLMPRERPPGFRRANRGAQAEIGPRIVRRKQLHRAFEERDRLALRETLQGVLARDRVLLRRLRDITSLLVMHRDDTGELALAFRIDRHERLRGELVQRATVLLEKRAVRRVLHESVPEEVLELGLNGGDPDQAARLERHELGLRRHRCRRLQEALEDAHAELAADDRCDAQRAPTFRRQSIDALEQQALERVRYLHVRHISARDPPVSRAMDRTAIDEHPDDLLDEEGIPFGLREDQVTRGSGQRFDLQQIRDERPRFIAREGIET